MKVFYEPEIEKSLSLGEDESIHALKVLRLNKGDKIVVLDGKGGFFEAEIIGNVGKKCQLKLLNKTIEVQQKPFSVHLAIAPTKNIDRIEWMLEKCCEIGVDEVSFVKTEHSERKEIKLDRLRKITIAAMKQSGGTFLTKLNELISLNDFFQIQHNSVVQKYIGYVLPEKTVSLQTVFKKDSSYVFLIGPEGDFSKNEIQGAVKLGFIPVSLGSKRLRTETAGLVACHSLVLLNEILR